jgi:hypothetical protein
MGDDSEYDPEWALPEFIDISIPEGSGRIIIKSKDGVIVDTTIKDEKYYSWVYAVIKQVSY